jgi:hypothetical protein
MNSMHKISPEAKAAMIDNLEIERKWFLATFTELSLMRFQSRHVKTSCARCARPSAQACATASRDASIASPQPNGQPHSWISSPHLRLLRRLHRSNPQLPSRSLLLPPPPRLRRAPRAQTRRQARTRLPSQLPPKQWPNRPQLHFEAKSAGAMNSLQRIKKMPLWRLARRGRARLPPKLHLPPKPPPPGPPARLRAKPCFHQRKPPRTSPARARGTSGFSFGITIGVLYPRQSFLAPSKNIRRRFGSFVICSFSSSTCPPFVFTRFELVLGAVASKGLTPSDSLAWWRQGSE